MTDRQFVLSKYPNAKLEFQVLTSNRYIQWYDVYSDDCLNHKRIRLTSGRQPTRIKAWRKAKKNICNSKKEEIRDWILQQAKYGISTWWMSDNFEYFHQTFYKELPAEKVVIKLRRILNKLEKEGLLKSTWVGLSDAAHEYGANRMKVWDAVF